MDEQSVTEFPIVNVSGIAVKLEQPSNMNAQLVTELGIFKVEGSSVKLEQ